MQSLDNKFGSVQIFYWIFLNYFISSNLFFLKYTLFWDLSFYLYIEALFLIDKTLFTINVDRDVKYTLEIALNVKNHITNLFNYTSLMYFNILKSKWIIIKKIKTKISLNLRIFWLPTTVHKFKEMPWKCCKFLNKPGI